MLTKQKNFRKYYAYLKSRQPLVIFLLNVLLNIEKFWNDFCFCTDHKLICPVCQMRVVYLNDQYDIYENSLILDFLLKFHQHLIKNLNNLLEIECHFVWKVINKKYFYKIKDIFDGSKKHFYLSEYLNEFENMKINEIKSNDFEIVL